MKAMIILMLVSALYFGCSKKPADIVNNTYLSNINDSIYWVSDTITPNIYYAIAIKKQPNNFTFVGYVRFVENRTDSANPVKYVSVFPSSISDTLFDGDTSTIFRFNAYQYPSGASPLKYSYYSIPFKVE